MAYLRKEQETVEMDYPLNKVWVAIPKALHSLKWTVEQINKKALHFRAKTKASLMSYSSIFQIDVVPVDKKTTRVSVATETPATTITAIVDLGRGRERIDLFFVALAKQLTS
jgi:predicted Mrr-cat superfamily restriction endonuclease